MRNHPWITVMPAIFAGIAIAILQNKVIPCIALLQSVFGLSAGTAGWLSSIFCVMGIVTAIPCGMLVEKLGLKRAGLAALFFGAVGGVVGTFAGNAGFLMFSRIIEGVGAGIIAVVVPALITGWFAPEKRGLPMSLWSSWQIVAQSLCFFFALSISERFGWQGVWHTGTLVVVCAAVLFALLVRQPDRQDISEGAAGSLFQAWRRKNVWRVCLAMFLFTLGNFAFVTWIADCWSVRFTIPLLTTNRYVSLMYLIALPMSAVVGFILNRVDHRIFCGITYGVYGILAGGGFLLPATSWILPYLLIYPVAETCVCASLWTLLPESLQPGDNLTSAMILFNILQNAGMLLGPPLSGMLLDSFGYPVLFFAAGLPCVLGAGILTRK